MYIRLRDKIGEIEKTHNNMLRIYEKIFTDRTTSLDDYISTINDSLVGYNNKVCYINHLIGLYEMAGKYISDCCCAIYDKDCFDDSTKEISEITKYERDDKDAQEIVDKTDTKGIISDIGRSMREQIRSTKWNEFIGNNRSKKYKKLSYLALLVKVILRTFNYTSKEKDIIYKTDDIYNEKFSYLVNNIELSDELNNAIFCFNKNILPIWLTADEKSTKLKSIYGESKSVKVKTWEFKAGMSYFEIKTVTENENDVDVIVVIENKNLNKDIVFRLDGATKFESIFKEIITYAKNFPKSIVDSL